MNDYSKISARIGLAAKSRSVDFSDLSFSPPQTPSYPRAAHKAQHDRPPVEGHDHPIPQPEEESGAGERFGVILSRNCSSASQRFRARERAHAATSLPTAVRRAFSMRTSSSVANGYRRIHDTAAEDGDGECDVEAAPGQPQEEGRGRRKKRGKIIRACKRLFGL